MCVFDFRFSMFIFINNLCSCAHQNRESGRENFSITYSSMNLFNIEKVLCVEYVIIIRVKSKNCIALCRKLIDAHLCIHIDGSELCQSNYTFIFFMHKFFIFRYSYVHVCWVNFPPNWIIQLILPFYECVCAMRSPCKQPIFAWNLTLRFYDVIKITCDLLDVSQYRCEINSISASLKIRRIS